MRYLVTGVSGQLGHDIILELNKRNANDEIIGIGISELDITDRNSVNCYLDQLKPDVIFHNAAYTAVEKAEEEVDLATKVNVLGTKYLVDAARRLGAKIIYISTDYVFDGTIDEAYEVDSTPNPLSVYGKTKLGGEEYVKMYEKSYIVRTSWVFGKNGNNFVRTMLRLAETKNEISVVGDQIGSPTYTKDLAVFLCDLAQTNKYGIYHATNEGYTSWYLFACKIFELTNKLIKVKNIKTKDYPTKATRPLNSRLSKRCIDDAGLKRLPTWEDALERYLKEIGV